MERAGMYTLESRKSFLAKLKVEQEKADQKAGELWGEYLDSLDVFHYCAESWLRLLPDVHQVGTEDRDNPATCRLNCLNILARRSLGNAKAVSLMLRHGMHSFALSSFLNLYEARADAEFIRLDETGLASQRWLNRSASGNLVYERSNFLRTADETSNEYRLRGIAIAVDDEFHSAEVPEGEVLSSVIARSMYVNANIRARHEEWPMTLYSRQEWDDLMNMLESAFLKASTPGYPAFTGSWEALSTQDTIAASAALTARSLLSYKTVIEEHPESTVHNQHFRLQIRCWADIRRAFEDLRVLSVKYI